MSRLVLGIIVGDGLFSLCLSSVLWAKDSSLSQKNSSNPKPSPSNYTFMCQDDTVPTPKKEFLPYAKPSYWVTVSPDGSFLSYMAPEGNEIIDVRDNSRGATMKAPGLIDLQFSADQKYLTLVNKHQSLAKQRKFGVEHGTSWYRYADLLKYFNASLKRNDPVFDGSQYPNEARRLRRVAIDREFYHHYHSMGILSDANGRHWHRILNDYQGVSGRDYHWQNGELKKGPIYYLGNDAAASDRYGNSYLDLPMLSKDAAYFGAYNRKTMTTQIFAIVDKKRHFAVDLGLETGKISFSFRNPKSTSVYVAFHVDFIVHEEGNKVTGEMGGQTKDILVLKLKETLDSQGLPTLHKVAYAKITQSQQMGEGYYYPQWSRDGSLFFVAVSNKGSSYRFVKVDSKEFHFLPFNLPQKLSPYDSDCAKERFHALVALGGMWSSQCTNYASKLTATEVALKALSLSERQCLALSKRWASEERQILTYASLFSLTEPHNRRDRIRPDGRWTEKGEQRRELIANRDDLDSLTVEDLKKACRDFKMSFDDICH